MIGGVVTTWVVHKTINEALKNVTELFPGKEVVMRLSAGEHIVSGLVLDANLSLSRLEIVAASNAPTIISSSISSTLLEVRAGSPPLKLQGLKLNGQILIEAGFDRAVEIAGCHFSASASQGRRLRASTFVRALLVSDGSVTVSDAVFEDLRGGALLVTGGEVRVYNSTFTENEAESGGALLVTGGKVAVGNSTFTDNKATDATEGGAIRVIGTNASLELANLTVITGSAGFGGSVASDVEWTYRLPAPLAHYVSDPEQDGTARNGAGSYDFDYPIPCAATLYGSSYNVKDQAAPSCTDSCPAGYYCGKQTVSPVPCQAGTYCPEESASETACPAGSYSNVSTDVAYNKSEHARILGQGQLATSDKACLDCGLGTFCPEKSEQPKACAPGTYGNVSKLQVCYACGEGTFQEESGQTACEVCKPGSYCQKGAVTPTECAAGRFSNRTDLSRASECKPCTAGFYCERGAKEPMPCPRGKVGIVANLTEEARCETCPGDTTSLPGNTFCTFCKTGFYESAEVDGPVAKVECAPCLEPDDGANCSETTTSDKDSLTHGSMSLATIRVKPKYWRLSANSTTLYMCLESADGSSSCVGGSDAGDENDYKKGHTGSGYCKAGHTGPLCQVCNTSDLYFDSDEAMECIQCPRISERLDLPMGCIGVLVALLLTAFIIKRSPFPHSAGSCFELPVRASKRCSERLREPIAEVKRKVKRVVARIRQLEIVPRCKLLFT